MSISPLFPVIKPKGLGGRFMLSQRGCGTDKAKKGFTISFGTFWEKKDKV